MYDIKHILFFLLNSCTLQIAMWFQNFRHVSLMIILAKAVILNKCESNAEYEKKVFVNNVQNKYNFETSN